MLGKMLVLSSDVIPSARRCTAISRYQMSTVATPSFSVSPGPRYVIDIHHSCRVLFHPPDPDEQLINKVYINITFGLLFSSVAKSVCQINISNRDPETFLLASSEHYPEPSIFLTYPKNRTGIAYIHCCDPHPTISELSYFRHTSTKHTYHTKPRSQKTKPDIHQNVSPTTNRPPSTSQERRLPTRPKPILQAHHPSILPSQLPEWIPPKLRPRHSRFRLQPLRVPRTPRRPATHVLRERRL